MSDNNLVAGMLISFLLAFFVGVCLSIGLTISDKAVKRDCDNYGKTQLSKDWYECKQIKNNP